MTAELEMHDTSRPDGYVQAMTSDAADDEPGAADGDAADISESGENGDSAATIKSVERAARILGFFTPSRPRLTLGEMTARLGVSKATAHRYAMALRKVNLLRYDRPAAEYTLGPQVLTLAAAARAGLPLITLAGPIMERLVREVNETVVLSVWDGEAPVVVRIDDSTERTLRISVRAGARLDLESAQSQVFRAFLETEELGDAAPTAADHEELRLVREHGIAMNTPGRHGVRTVAAPVFGDGRVVAVLAVVGTTSTVADDISSGTAKAVIAAAETLTARLGAPFDE